MTCQHRRRKIKSEKKKHERPQEKKTERNGTGEYHNTITHTHTQEKRQGYIRLHVDLHRNRYDISPAPAAEPRALATRALPETDNLLPTGTRAKHTRTPFSIQRRRSQPASQPASSPASPSTLKQDNGCMMKTERRNKRAQGKASEEKQKQ